MQATTESLAPEPAVWPSPIVENFVDGWPTLSNNAAEHEVEQWVIRNKRILIRTATWNLCAKPPPAIESMRVNLLPVDRFHVYVIGTEECERSIAQSALNPSKKTWEAYLKEAIGPNYLPIRSHTLQAIHLMVFVHRKIAHMCSVVTSAAVPTGMGSTLGNKGGVGLFFKIGHTRFLIVNAHLAAHQTAENRRNAEFNRINKMIPVLLEKKEASVGSTKPTKSPAKQINNSTPSVPRAGSNDGSATVASENAGEAPTDTNQITAVDAQPAAAPATSVEVTALAPEPHALETVVNNIGEIVEVVDRCESSEGAPSPAPLGGSDSNFGPASASNSIAPEEDAAPTPAVPVDPIAAVIAAAVQTGSVQDATAVVVSGAAGIAGGPEEPEIPPGVDGIEADNALDDTDNAVAYHNEADNTMNSMLESNMYNGPMNGNLPDEIAENEAESNADVNVVNKLDGTAILDVTEVSGKMLENTAEFVVFMGDLNYRIKGNRKIVSSLVDNNMHEVLLHNDQLTWNMARGLVLQNFTEGPLNFKPTYKYDVGTAVYDTSSKGRIPSWTDRILYIPRHSVECLAYNADDSVMTSDHRPVFASFSVEVDLPEGFASSGSQAQLVANNGTVEGKNLPEFTSESQVCTIM